MTLIKLGDKNIPFIYQGTEMLYPNPIKDGLLLWYDFKGIKNSDKIKAITEDLTGRSNRNAQHYNFGYIPESGYGNKGLKFDGVDDRIIPIFKDLDDNVGQLNMKKINNGQEFSVEVCFKMSNTPITKGSEIFMTNGTFGRFWLQFLKDNAHRDKNEFIITTSTYYGTEGGRSVYAYSSKEGYKYGDEFHLTATLNKNDKLKLYVNGELKGEQKLSDINISTPQEQNLLVILGLGSQETYYRRFEHELYSLKIYQKVLSEQEVQHNYNLEKERWEL